ncbi:ATP-binding protein [Marinobacter zhejiangensis]|uniref:histidine kinase n=1 Tax=Marinobacter zhejiangensis TaxID=488535 RepID=A0A1I4M905_9GAMM|nr:ATP-binding protein [Marinobacter zhejiangensis]SFL99752.1 PAS domain S-box-containing protein [Marinobacter zhejiangensis]
MLRNLNRESWVRVLLWGGWVCVALVTTLGGYTLDQQYRERYHQERRADVTQQLAILRAQLEGTVGKNLQVVQGLVAVVSADPSITQQRFGAIASEILAQKQQLRNIGAAPDMVIRMIYPLTGNEAALGLDYRANAHQWPKVRQAAESGELVLDGPLTLVQGGRGFIGRVPVFSHRLNGDGRYLWGLVSAVIDVDALYQEAGIYDVSDLLIALRKVESDGQPGAVFYGSDELFGQAPVTMPVAVGGGSWQLAAVPADGWRPLPPDVVSFRGLLFAAAALILLPGLGMALSIQRERKSQRRLQSLFELSPLGMALVDAQSGRFLSVNASLCAMTAMDVGQLHAVTVSRILPPPLPWADLGGEPRFGPLESLCLSADGHSMPILLAGARVQEARNRELVWLALQDISEQKRVEQMKNEFISTVSHELRTPLTSISGALKLTSEGMVGELPDKAREMVGIALKNSERLAQLINDLLDMDKLVSGKLGFNIRPLALAPMMKTSLENLEVYAHNHDVVLEYSNQSSRCSVLADDLRFLQVMDNLVSNAIKFSPAGGTVRVSSELLDGQVQISVCDQGDGIPESFHSRVFEKFAQADGSDRRVKGGTGLGLAISRGLLLHMNGSIRFDSEPGKGTCFYVTLPRAD